MENLNVERSIWIKAPCERVSDALTNPYQLAQWFVPNLPGAVMSRDEKGKVAIHMGPMAVDFMVVNLAGAPGRVAARNLPDQILDVTYQLAEQGGGTQVTVTVSGFERYPADAREDRLAFVGDAWHKTLQNLGAFVDGAALPFPNAYVGPLFGFWREQKPKLAIERSIWIDGPIDRVWKAVTDPKQIQVWYSPSNEWELSALEVGGRFYIPNPETKAEQFVEVIEALDAPRQLVTRVLPEPPDTVVKTKAYRLAEENQGTRLTLTLTGYAPQPENWNGMEENAFGFGMVLQNAKAYVEGQALPFVMGF